MFLVCSSSLAFFSEKKINTLSELLGNDALRRLIEALEGIIETRLLVRSGTSLTMSPVTFMKPSRVEEVPLQPHMSMVGSSSLGCELLCLYVNYSILPKFALYVQYPFLNQRDFKERALAPSVQKLLNANPAFATLYHTVLALGSQYHEGGTWEPGKGKVFTSRSPSH
jgi:hypothetical protein